MTGDLETIIADLVRRVVRDELDAKLDELVVRLANQPPSRYVTYREAAAIASVSTRTLESAVASGDLVAVRRGRSVRIELDELDRWLARDTCSHATG